MKDKSAQREQLARCWELMANSIERALTADNPSASSLEVARKWLEANGVTLDVVRSWRMNGHGFDPTSLPVFQDDDDSGGDTPAEVAPLRVVAPFAPTDNS